MTKPLSVAVLGFWHVHADDYARLVREHPDTELVAAWDPDEARGREGAERLGVEFAADLDELLARPDLDGVTVTTATNEHPDVIGAAIAAGKHVFTEKVLAATVDDADSLVRRASAAGVALVVSLPQLSVSRTLAAKRLLDEGALGDLTYVRFRMAHDGWLGGWLPDQFGDPEAAIGGALTDLGCHPVYLVQHFLGARPETVTSTYASHSGHAVEDNAVVSMRYPGGAIGVAEASNVTVPGAFAFELRGTKGTLLYGFGREALVGKGGSLGDSWQEVDLGDDGEPPFDLWVRAIRGDADTTANTTAAIDLTRLVVAANSSAATGTAIRL